MSDYVKEAGGDYTFSRSVSGDEVLSLAQDIISKQFQRGVAIGSPEDTEEFFRLQLGSCEQEVFSCLFLDTRHRVISFETLFYGTIDGASVYPREVLKRCLHHNAAAVIFSHNHPSGLGEPSRSDRSLTKRLTEALTLIDVRVLDHIVIGEDVVSFAKRGWL